MQIDFCEATHEYKVNGIVYPSVTQIIASANLIDTTFFTDASRERGRDTHTACELLDDDNLDWASVSEVVLPRVKAYLKFLSEVKPEWHLIEHKVFSEAGRYCGRIDRAGMVLGKRAIVDIKTGQESDVTGVQGAAYMSALPGFYSKFYGLYLFADEKYKLIEYSGRIYKKVFDAANLLHQYKNKRRN